MNYRKQVLPQLRGRAEVQAFAQQGTGKNRAGIAFLQGGVSVAKFRNNPKNTVS